MDSRNNKKRILKLESVTSVMAVLMAAAACGDKQSGGVQNPARESMSGTPKTTRGPTGDGAASESKGDGDSNGASLPKADTSTPGTSAPGTSPVRDADMNELPPRVPEPDVAKGPNDVPIDVPIPGGGDGPAAISKDLAAGDRSQDKLYVQDDFALWIPGGVSHLRGIVLTNPRHPVRQEFARLHNFAAFDTTEPRRRDGAEGFERLKQMLQQLASKAGHPELVHAPMVATGYSYTSGISRNLVQHMPERFLGFSPGGLEVGPKTDAMRKVPWLNWYGGADGSQPTAQLSAALRERAAGALFGIAPHWGVEHDWNQGTNILLPMWHQSAIRRYPNAKLTPSGPLTLVDIPPENGWLGSLADYDTYRVKGPQMPVVASFKTFKGDKSKATWILDSYMAHVWQAYSQDPGTPVTIESPLPHTPSNPVPLVEVGAKLSVRARASVPPGQTLQRMELYSGDQKLLEVSSFPDAVQGKVAIEFQAIALSAAAHSLIVRAYYSNGSMRLSRPHTVQVMRVPCPPGNDVNGTAIVCVRKGG